jgi:cell division protein FtsL
MNERKITYNQLVVFLVMATIAFAFTLGITTFSLTQMFIMTNKLKKENSILKSENNNLKIEVSGLNRLIELKDTINK